MLNPFIEVISMAIHLLEMALFVWIILGLLIHFDVINAYQPIVARVRQGLDKLFNPMLRPIRNFLPDFGGLDLSPIILILAFRFIDSALFHWFYNL